MALNRVKNWCLGNSAPIDERKKYTGLTVESVGTSFGFAERHLASGLAVRLLILRAENGLAFCRCLRRRSRAWWWRRVYGSSRLILGLVNTIFTVFDRCSVLGQGFERVTGCNRKKRIGFRLIFHPWRKVINYKGGTFFLISRIFASFLRWWSLLVYLKLFTVAGFIYKSTGCYNFGWQRLLGITVLNFKQLYTTGFYESALNKPKWFRGFLSTKKLSSSCIWLQSIRRRLFDFFRSHEWGKNMKYSNYCKC